MPSKSQNKLGNRASPQKEPSFWGHHPPPILPKLLSLVPWGRNWRIHEGNQNEAWLPKESVPIRLDKIKRSLPRWVMGIFGNFITAEGGVAKDTKPPILVGNN